LTHPTYTLLIVEDAPTDRELYRRLLLKDPNCDYELLEAETVVDGLEFCLTRCSRGEATPTIDAILLDYQLPDGNGIKFLTALAAQSNDKLPPVVMLTGQGDENIAVRAMKLGAQDYLVKSNLTPELLQSSIRNAISSDRFRQQLAQIELARIEAEKDRDRFFNLSLDLLAIASFDGYFLRLNPAWEKLLGFSNAELMAQPYLDLVHPDDRHSTVAAADSLDIGTAVIEFENRYRCQDGSYRWLLWNSMPDAEQNVTYAIAHDITERKHNEAALRSSERKFSAIFDQTFELLGLLSLDGTVLELNQTALKSLAQQIPGTMAARQSALIGKLFWETPWWNHSPLLQAQLQQSISQAAGGQFIRYDMQYPSPSRDLVDIDFTLQPMCDETGRVVTLLAKGHDITAQQAVLRERERAERDLLESQERLRTGIEVAGVGLARFDYTTNLVALSPEAAALYGFAPDITFVSREQIHDTFHPDERAGLAATIAKVVDPDGAGWFAHDHRVVWPNGEVRCLSVRKQVFFARDGAVLRPSYAILAAIDITERQQNQADLEQRNRELDSFVYVVSHDLKAPLRAVANLSEWIEEDLAGSRPPIKSK
jgi:PAS domain S-box-containing protein